MVEVVVVMIMMMMIMTTTIIITPPPFFSRPVIPARTDAASVIWVPPPNITTNTL